MGTMMSKITTLTIVYSTIYSGADQRKHQSSASLAFVRGIHRWSVNFPHKWPATRKRFSFDDVIMWIQLSTRAGARNPKTESCHDTDPAVTGGTWGCRLSPAVWHMWHMRWRDNLCYFICDFICRRLIYNVNVCSIVCSDWRSMSCQIIS